MSEKPWTVQDEDTFQRLRRQRGGEPFADVGVEAVYQAEKRRRYDATPDAEMLDRQLAEQRGDLPRRADR
jgi:hypothetical protein